MDYSRTDKDRKNSPENMVNEMAAKVSSFRSFIWSAKMCVGALSCNPSGYFPLAFSLVAICLFYLAGPLLPAPLLVWLEQLCGAAGINFPPS